LVAAGLAVVIATSPDALAAMTLVGAATSGFNPKALLLFVAVLPQFVDRHGGLPIAVQIGVLGAIHMANCAVAYLALGTLARTTLAGRPTAADAVARASGVAMILLGVLLLVDRAVASL
jgi:threonine/homoserine/homoserine lactone efflux protein